MAPQLLHTNNHSDVINLRRNGGQHGIMLLKKTSISPESKISTRQQQSRICTATDDIWTNLLSHYKSHHSSINNKFITHLYICHDQSHNCKISNAKSVIYSLKFQQIKTRGTLKERKILQENKHCTFGKAIIIDTNCPFRTIGTKRPYSEGPNFTILQNMSNRLLLVPNKLK